MQRKKSRIIRNLIQFRSYIVHSKLFMQRTMSWISILNAGMLLFLVLSKLQEYGYGIYITKWFFPIFAVTLILMILFGFLEDKLGFFRKEVEVTESRNPFYKEILERVDKIEKGINSKK